MRFKSLVPTRVKRLISPLIKIVRVIINHVYDVRRYLKHSAELNDNSELKLEAKITETYHVLEKGLGMIEVKQGFGQGKVSILIDLLKRYIKEGYSLDRSQIKAAVSTLNAYFDYHAQLNDHNINKLKEKAEDIFKTIRGEDVLEIGGSYTLNGEELVRKAKGDFKELAFSRHSIRNFSPEDVDLDKIKEAINIARKTPSVCNRQSSRVYIVNQKENIRKILALQNGNRGFGHTIKCVLIVTSDLNAFKGAGERNQGFIDGGMFAMSLLYALHYVGLGACPLNWCVSRRKDQALRKQVKIRDSENIIMFIGVGNIPEKVNVAKSYRKPIEEITYYL